MLCIHIGDGVLILLNRHVADNKERRDAGAEYVGLYRCRVSRLNVIGCYIMLDSDCPIEGSYVPIFR